ncbi:CoA-binding protein [Desulfobacula sp.]|uniref:CoA-binding protein n=1 Tax=Desulfobacula sp. TaxID=2593537 RepID=UPI002633192F|nr:CoA-binding protein [Desulfobacula sp.]
MEIVAVIGASPKQDRYSNKAIRMLAQYHHTPIPVAPTHALIEGRKVYQHLEDIPEKIDTVTLYVSPSRQEPIIKDIIKLGPKRVIFNPDTENKAVYDQLKQAGIEVVEACTLVLLKTNQFSIPQPPRLD